VIKAEAKLSVQRIPLSCLQVLEIGKPDTCHIEKVVHYTKLLQDNPDMDLDPIMTIPLEKHPGIFGITNGKHRFLSYILAGRYEQPCVITEGPK
jgi:hypothetical protein